MKLPRFSLRDLFWLVLVVAMGCAWWVNYSRMSSEVQRLKAVEQSYLGLQVDLKYSDERIRALQRVIATGGGKRDRREE